MLITMDTSLVSDGWSYMWNPRKVSGQTKLAVSNNRHQHRQI
jgi:hypothetical protein